jgi:hypothetical protein
MAKINFSKIASRVLSEQTDEKKITEYKDFFKKYLIKVKNAEAVLHELNLLYFEFFNFKLKPVLALDLMKKELELKAERFLTGNFQNEVAEVYNKKLPRKNSKTQNLDDKPLWAQILVDILSVPGQIDVHEAEQWKYKTSFLLFLHNCLYHTGLHPLINNREADIYKRYNLHLEHDFKSKVKQADYKILIGIDKLQNDFLAPYEKRKPILLNGKLIPHKNIHRLKITSTLLLDDEIELFAKKKKFCWTVGEKNELLFTENCLDETDTLLRNPFLLEKELSFRNNSTYFVDPERIVQLSKIKNKNFDLIKLVQLCKELNDVSVGANHFSSSYLVRTIIDHVPPVFGVSNFNEVANNYTGGTRSFKKSMLNLNTSLRNIADNNIHSQIRDKEILPTPVQSDFTPDLDLLLSEIVRILK